MSNNKKYILVGYSEYIYNETNDSLDIREEKQYICFVNSEKEGQDYIESQYNPKEREKYHSWRSGGPFLKKSPLSSFLRVEVEINPLLNLPELKNIK